MKTFRDLARVCGPALIVGLVLRVAVMLFYYHTGRDMKYRFNDIDTFATWTVGILRDGAAVYRDKSIDPWVDYAPGFVYFFGFLGRLFTAIVGDVRAHQAVYHVFVKSAIVLTDLVAIVAGAQLAARVAGARAASFAAWLLALAPPLWFDSAINGQVEVFAWLGLAASMLFTLERKFAVAVFCLLVSAILFKPQAIAAFPVLATWWLRERASLRDLGVGVAASLAVVYVASLPFVPEPQPLAVFGWLVSLYTATVGGYVTGTMSNGAWNLHSIYGTPYHFPDSVKLAGIALRTWATALAGLAIIGVTVWFARRPRLSMKGDAIFAVTLALGALFYFAGGMHERYVYQTVATAAVLASYDRASRLPAAVIAAIATLNLAASCIGVYNGEHWRFVPAAIRLLSVIAIVAFIALARRLVSGRRVPA